MERECKGLKGEYRNHLCHSFLRYSSLPSFTTPFKHWKNLRILILLGAIELKALIMVVTFKGETDVTDNVTIVKFNPNRVSPKIKKITQKFFTQFWV